MMKIVFVVLFFNFMMLWNKMLMFYYNMCYLISFMILFMYMYKDCLWSNLSIVFGLEYYSIFLVMLSFWIISLMMMCLSLDEGSVMMKLFFFINLLIILELFFMSMNLILFYFFYEVSLIPTFFLIIYWGSNMERLSASYYLMMYMLIISFPLLVYLVDMYYYSMTFVFSLMSMYLGGYLFSFGSYMMIFGSFFIKMPMYLFHIWLPKAHVEAPVYGSMILAGVLLKMGSYGLLRLLVLFMDMSLKYNYLILSLGLLGSLISGILCLVQIDMKSLVAYSSVVHMNLMLCSFMTMFKLSFVGGYIMMISHGLCSSGLFYMVNLFYYRTSSRLLIFNKGMMVNLPSLMIWWFLLCAANFSFPLSLNFISEMLMLMVLLNWDLMLIMSLMLICFFSSAYSLYLYSYIQHGWKSFNNLVYNFGTMKEFIVLIMHFYPLIMYLFNLVMFM
uniref:NADH-ubiquinone oxidoreductase chain 4 n=1 Tax=Monomorium pharaonis TaxID=307658 RepID=A0A7L8EYP0_MONPH|nr:NADH dehydrogenase subunit 4 [Monomorium pharaonis]QOE17527.1 NADH dehydrogenase subunit 4 [Monomorium pharaonis]